MGSLGNCRAYTPVYLPNDAIVTNVKVRYFDCHTENVIFQVCLARIHNTGTSTGSERLLYADHTSSGESYDIRTCNYYSIDNNTISSDYSYYMYLAWNPLALGDDLRFYGVRITYTVDQVTP